MSSNDKKSLTPEVRNRIVGSVILLIAAIVILPSLISSERISLKDDFKQVPAKPQFEVVANDKSFPQAAFDQNMPKQAKPVNEIPVDAEPATQIVEVEIQDTADEPQVEKVETDKLTISPISKPKTFMTSEQLKAKQQAEEQSEQVVNRGQYNQQSDDERSSDSQFSTQAWVIQLGSFSNKANADAIEKKLNDAGFTTFSRQIKSTRGPLTKVYVGPELDKKVLQQSLARVNKVASVKGLVTSFTIRR